MISHDDIVKFCQTIFKSDAAAIKEMIHQEPYVSNLNELLSYDVMSRNENVWYELCHVQFEEIFLSLAPLVSKEVWLTKSIYGANLLMKSLVSNSLAIFNCVYDTGLFDIKDVIPVAIASNSKAMIQRIDELGLDYSQAFMFDWVEDQFQLMSNGKTILAIDAIEEIFKTKYNINFKLTDTQGNNIIHKVVGSQAKDEDNIIKVIEWAMAQGVNILDANSDKQTVLDMCCRDHVPREKVVNFLLTLKEIQNIDLLSQVAFGNHKTLFFNGSEKQKKMIDLISIMTEKNKLNQTIIESNIVKKIKI
jgi:hypothetical protein